MLLAFEFIPANHFRQIDLEQAGLLAFQLRQRSAQRALAILQCLREPFASLGPGQFMGYKLRIGQNAAKILPDQQVQRRGWRIARRRAFALRRAQSIPAPATAIVGIASAGQASGTGQATLAATDEATQQVVLHLIIAPRPLLVLLQTLLGHIESLLANDSRHWDGDPFLFWRRLLAIARAHWLHGRLAPASWYGARPTTIRSPGIRRRTEDATHRGYIPAHTTPWGWDLPVIQRFSYPIQRSRCGWISIPSENLLDHLSLDQIHADAGRIPRPFRVQDVAIGRKGPGQQQTAPHLGLSPAAHPVRNQAALILGHRTTNLQQQLVVGIVTHGPIQELDLTAIPVQFFDQQHLVHVLPCQPIRCSHQHQLNTAQGNLIAQPIQPRTIQPCPAVAIVAIDVLVGQVPLLLANNMCTQPLQLLLNRLRLLLATRRNADIQCNFHFVPPLDVMMQAQSLWYPPSSNSEETGRHNPSGAARLAVRPGCDSLPIAVSWFLPSSDGFAWEDTPAGSIKRLSQPQWPSPPRQLQLTPARHTEFVICDHTIEHGFRDWKTHLRLKGTLRALNIAYVCGLMLVLALLYWFVCLCGLRWNHPRFRSRIACWGTPSFFKTALDLLITHDPLALAAWPHILAWIHGKLKFFQPCQGPMLFVIAATVPGTYKLGN